MHRVDLLPTPRDGSLELGGEVNVDVQVLGLLPIAEAIGRVTRDSKGGAYRDKLTVLVRFGYSIGNVALGRKHVACSKGEVRICVLHEGLIDLQPILGNEFLHRGARE